MIGLVLVLSSGEYFGQGIVQVIGSSIGISEVRSIGFSLVHQPVGRSLGRLIKISCLLQAWSRWPCLQGAIGVSYQYKYTQLLNIVVLATKELTNNVSILWG